MSAGNSFQVGIARGKFHGVISAQTPIGVRTDMANLFGQLGRRGLAEQPAPFAGIEKGAVDPFLDVAAGFFEYLAHLAGLDARQFFFVLFQQIADPVENLAALGRGHQAPTGKSLLGSLYRRVDIGNIRSRKQTDQIVAVGWIAVLESLF